MYLLSRRLNGTYSKVKVKIDDIYYTCNHLLFIDDLKLVLRTYDDLKSMVEETKSFFRTVGLEINVEKSTTNSPLCENDAKLLGLTETIEGKNDEGFFDRIVQSIESRAEALCNTNLNAKNLIRAMNEFAISQINYYVGIIDTEPD
ncbi:hypothetical protein NGRA_1649 [Nosema granulosis]|uniref:Reverse transcriptase domain-containing protein n=1 Tax=Nosema granulosis TaxID=83296 RepID=A0A9P6GY25_9MICR|nr:hypothetical protein NGRA_1649 [Nosema granulosis]